MIKKTMLLFVCFLSIVGTARAQVLTTAETLGKGKQGVFFTENRLFADGDQLNIIYGQYIRGLSGRFDLYTSFGGTRIFRQNQVWVGIGGNYHLFRMEKIDISSFNILSLPLHRRHDSSTVLFNSAIVVSRNVTKEVILYSGINSLIPIGAVSRGIFTPPTKKINLPLGIAIFKGKWSLFAEVDIGKLKAVGIGISRSL